MQRQWRSLRALTRASIKMYFRNRTAVFFTLFIPLFLIAVFGLLSNGSGGNITIDVTNYSHNQASQQFIQQLKSVKAFKVEQVSESEAADKLGRGKTDLQVIISSNFGATDPATHRIIPSAVKTYYNAGQPQNGQTASLVISELLDGFNVQLTHTSQPLTVQEAGIKTNNQNEIDFLLPGVIGFSVMQLGIFSVAFAFVSYKSTGALRRLQVTPTHPLNFLIGQSIARLIIGFLQVAILLGVGIRFFHVHMLGNIGIFLGIETFGVIMFLMFGFAVAGWAKDENQAAPISQLITFPMIFLSGVFFPTTGLPAWLHRIVAYLPLTYLVDSARRVANEGATLWQVRGDLLGMTVWTLVVLLIAVRVFKWE